MGSEVTPVILAAGMGTRLGSGVPKCLREVGGQTLLERAFASLAGAGLERVCLVVGHQSQTILDWCDLHPTRLRVDFVFNPGFAEGSMSSLRCAVSATEGPLLVIESDLLYPASLVRALLNDPRPDLVPVGPPRHRRPWLVEQRGGQVVAWGYDWPGATEELVGLYKLSRNFARALLHLPGTEFWDSMLEVGFPLSCLPVLDCWDEVDTAEDLERVQAWT